MQDLCPLCLKSGIKKKIKLLQINLQEAVWMCEEEKCIWPLGYEDFVFCPRAVGKIWSCYWDDYKPTITKLKENITSTKLSLCNTLVSPKKYTPKEMIDDLNIYYIENINITNNDSNIINSKTILDQSTSVFEEPSMIGNIDIKEQYNDNNIILNKEINNINIHNKNFQLIDNNIENIKIKNEWINTLNKNIKENISSIENIKNANRRTPKITNVEKTNIDISSINVGNQISVYQDSNKKILNIESKNITEAKLISKIEALPNLKSNKNSESVLKSNLNVTKMEIDGLPPITLSFEIPVCTTTTETVKNIMQQTDYKNNNTKSNSTEIKNTFVKRNITSGKQYEKFSFSAIKKNKESSSSNIINNINNNSLNMKTNPTVKTENYLTETDINAASISNQFNNSITSFNQESITSDILATNTSINIDTVLEDYLTNDYNVSEDINDEWINSLLS